MASKTKGRVNTYLFSEDVELALNKMSLEDKRSKNMIINIALEAHLKKHGYLSDKGEYVNSDRK